MPARETPLPFEPRLLIGVGLSLWLVAALASVWEVLALQPPDSPFHFGVLAGPIAQLCNYAFALGSSGLLVALLWPRLYPSGRARMVALSWSVGALLHVGVLLVAASRGLLAVQLLDPRSDARMLLYGRGLALCCSCAAVVLLLVQLLRRHRAPSASDDQHARIVGKPEQHRDDQAG